MIIFNKLNDDKSLSISTKVTNYQGENEAETLRFLIHKTFNDFNISTASVILNVKDTANIINTTFMLSPELELYSDYYVYNFSITDEFTQAVNTYTYWLTILNSDSKLLKSGDGTFSVVTKPTTSSLTTEVEKDTVEQLIITVANKADGLSYANNVLQLTRDGNPIGNQVTIIAGESSGSSSVVTDSTTNGNILINGAEINVYTHPTGTNPHGTTATDIGLGSVDNIKQMPLSYLSIDGSLISNSDIKIPSEKAVKTYSDTKLTKANADTYYEAKNSNIQSHISSSANPHSTTASQVGLGNVENKSSATIRGEITSQNITNALGYTPINSTLKGSLNGLAELDANGKVHSSQLPSYVDDVIEGTLATFPTTGESGKIYIDTNDGKTYRWSGSTYGEISASLALGENSSTAYRGDRGKVAYDHSQTAHAPALAQANNISDTNATDLTDGTDTTLHYHGADRNRANHTGTQLASTISDFASTVRSTILTGLSTATNAVVSATDTVLSAIGKLQAQISALISDATIIDITESTNTFTANFNSRPSINRRITISDTTAKTIAVSSVPTETEMYLVLVYTSTAAITWFSGITWLSGSAPTLVAGKTYEMSFKTSNGGVIWRGGCVGGW